MMQKYQSRYKSCAIFSIEWLHGVKMWHKPSQKHEKLPFTAWSKFGNIWLHNPEVKNDVIYKSKDL